MRRFYLQRKEDPTGMSGVGRVADGVEFENGQVALTWKREFHSVTVFQSISIVEKLHTHNGKDPTKIIWVDDIREDIEAKAEELRLARKAEQEAEEAAEQAAAEEAAAKEEKNEEEKEETKQEEVDEIKESEEKDGEE